MRSFILARVVVAVFAVAPLDATASGPSSWQQFRAADPYHVDAIAGGITRVVFGTPATTGAPPIDAPDLRSADSRDKTVSAERLVAWFGLQRPAPSATSRTVAVVLGIAMVAAILALLRTRRMKWLAKAGGANAGN